MAKVSLKIFCSSNFQLEYWTSSHFEFQHWGLLVGTHWWGHQATLWLGWGRPEGGQPGREPRCATVDHHHGTQTHVLLQPGWGRAVYQPQKPCEWQRCVLGIGYILLLLRSQLCLWGSLLWVRFLFVFYHILNPTIEVVTFRLCGWCKLGIFLLLAFTCQGHERQDLLSPCDGMHVCTDWT